MSMARDFRQSIWFCREIEIFLSYEIHHHYCQQENYQLAFNSVFCLVVVHKLACFASEMIINVRRDNDNLLEITLLSNLIVDQLI